MSKETRCSDILSKDNECIVQFKPCEIFKEVNINIDMEPEPDKCCCNSPEQVDNKFIMALVCSIINQLDFKCRKCKHKHKHKHKHNHKYNRNHCKKGCQC